MSTPGWLTKEDMLRDLAVVGGRVGCVDDGFLASGERPPPPLVIQDDDEEYELMFGTSVRDARLPEKEMPSDLKGITKMIRMVQDYENTPDNVKKADVVEISDDNVLLVISKLNPQAQEFVPVVASPTQRPKVEETAASLKNTISEAAEDNSHDKVREKNTAIARLLKLYARPTTSTDKASKPVKLYTPDFYQHCKATEYEKTDLDSRTNKEINTVIKSQQDEACERRPIFNSNITQAKISEKSLDKVVPIANRTANNNNVDIKANSTERTKITLLTPDMLQHVKLPESSKVSSQTDVPSDLEMADSIQKVNSWLEKKSVPEPVSKPVNPTAYLNTVAFKRKDPTTCKSPSEIGDKKIAKQNSEKVFVPSTHASELRKKYQNRIKDNVKQMNIWDKLEYDLKQKDLEIKARANKPKESGDATA